MPPRPKPEWMRIARELTEEARKRCAPPPPMLVKVLHFPKYCPRCNGNMYADGDGGASCLMCGEYIAIEIKEKMIQSRVWPPKGQFK